MSILRILAFVSLWIAASALPAAKPVKKLDQSRSDVRKFVEEMTAEHGFERSELVELLAEIEIQQSILDAISRPAEKTKPWHEYREIFITEERIRRGVDFWNANTEAVKETAHAFGIPPEIVVAIIGVETYYGRRTGSYRVIDALGTLAFDYPPRAKFFRSELKHFLLLSREESVQALEATGSYAGAMGMPQFMPSSYRSYAVDSDEDGRRDLWANLNDVLGSVANYLHVHGWQPSQPVAVRAEPNCEEFSLAGDSLEIKETVSSLRERGLRIDTELPDDTPALLIALDAKDGKEYWVGFKNFYVITRYNRSLMYAMAIHQLGREIAGEMNDERT